MEIYDQIKRVAERSHRSVDDVLVEAVMAVAPVIDTAPETYGQRSLNWLTSRGIGARASSARRVTAVAIATNAASAPTTACTTLPM